MNMSSQQLVQKSVPPIMAVQGRHIQRKCDCGTHTMSDNECTSCANRKGKLQRKLSIGASNDPLEHEADRVADQVMSMSANSSIARSTPKIQCASTSASGSAANVPASVSRVLSSSGRPMQSGLRQDMEDRFGQNFSQVRMHTSTTAEQSARDVNAHAYTVGNNVVFGAGQFAPGTNEGRRLLAHELAHVVQQSSNVGFRIQRQPAPDVNKSGKYIEDLYRSGARQLDDPVLSDAASNVQNCREFGGYYCEILVNDDDIHSMYAEWTLIESVFGQEEADKAIADHKLGKVANLAAETLKQAAAMQETSNAQSGLAAVGGVALAQPTLAPPTPGPPASPTLTLVPKAAPPL